MQARVWFIRGSCPMTCSTQSWSRSCWWPYLRHPHYSAAAITAAAVVAVMRMGWRVGRILINPIGNLNFGFKFYL